MAYRGVVPKVMDSIEEVLFLINNFRANATVYSAEV